MPIFFSPSSSFGGIGGDPNFHLRGNPLYRQPNMPGFIQRRSATGMSPSERYAQAVRAEERRKKREARWARADEAAAAKREERKAAKAKQQLERKARREKYWSPEEVARRSRETKARLDRRKAAAAAARDRRERPAPSTQFSNQPGLSLSSAFASGEPQATSDAVAPLSNLMPNRNVYQSAVDNQKKLDAMPKGDVVAGVKGLADLGPARTRTATPSAAFGYPTGQAPSFRYSPNQANAQRFYIDQPPPAMFQALPEDRYTQPIYNYLGDLVGDLGNAFGAAGGQLFNLPNSVNQALRNARGF